MDSVITVACKGDKARSRPSEADRWALFALHDRVSRGYDLLLAVDPAEWDSKHDRWLAELVKLDGEYRAMMDRFGVTR